MSTCTFHIAFLILLRRVRLAHKLYLEVVKRFKEPQFSGIALRRLFDDRACSTVYCTEAAHRSAQLHLGLPARFFAGRQMAPPSLSLQEGRWSTSLLPSSGEWRKNFSLQRLHD